MKYLAWGLYNIAVLALTYFVFTATMSGWSFLLLFALATFKEDK